MKRNFYTILIFGLTCYLLLLFDAKVKAQSTTETFSTPGTFTWVVPPCIYSVTVEVWGGGGGGGSVWSRWQQSCTNTSCQGAEICQCGGGGGGGGYARRTYSVTPGQSYTIVVGAGGIASVNSSGDNRANPGGNGGNSTFSGPATLAPGILTGHGGRGGGAANNIGNCLGNGCSGHGGVNGTGGSGGIGQNGTTLFNGGAGATGRHSGSETDKSGGGGGGAGSSGSGTNGGVINGGTGGSGGGGNGGSGIDQPYNSGYLGSNGIPGQVIGGGGGGAAQHNRIGLNRSSATNHVSQVGGNGQRGEVRLTYNLVNAGGVRNLPTGQQCSGTTLNFSSNPTGGNGVFTFSWIADINNDGIADVTGTSNTFSFAAVNNGSTTIQNNVTLTVSNNGDVCAQQVFTPNINPIPTVNDPSDQILCPGQNSAAVNFSGNAVANTTFNWNNNNTSIGLAASGSGNIPVFNAQTVGVATVTVTPVSSNGTFPSCTGTPQIFIFDVQNCILPVEWLYFKGSREGIMNQLFWATAAEINCSHFEVQHSKNALDFVNIGSLESQSAGAASSQPLHYEFTHHTNDSPIDYYRIKMVETDGTYQYSNIVAIEENSELSDLILYPNPADEILYIEISSNHLGKTFEILNALGQVYGTGIFDEHRMSFSTQDLNSGVYYLLIEGISTKKFMLK